MGKHSSNTVWLVVVSLVLIAAMLLIRRDTHAVMIGAVAWEDHHSACTVSFTVINNTAKEQPAKIEIVAERTRESRVGTAIALVGTKKVEVRLAPHERQEYGYSLPLASAYTGSLVVRCTLAR